MKTEFTKGEWSIADDFSHFETTIMCGDTRIAEVKHFTDFENDPSINEGRANAKLIAAAPDLLLACNELLELLKFHGYTRSTEIYQAQEAIKKATE